MANQKHLLPTYHWQEGPPGQPGRLKDQAETREYILPYSEADAGKPHYGMRITESAFAEMIKAFDAHRRGNPEFDIAYVEFSKTSLLRVLSEPHCELVRFYFAFPEPGKLSLAFHGCDSMNRGLGAETLLRKLDTQQPSVADEPDDTDYEEKGNGGGSGSVRLFSEVMDKLKKNGELKFLEEALSPEEKTRKLAQALLKTINNL